MTITNSVLLSSNNCLVCNGTRAKDSSVQLKEKEAFCLFCSYMNLDLAPGFSLQELPFCPSCSSRVLNIYELHKQKELLLKLISGQVLNLSSKMILAQAQAEDSPFTPLRKAAVRNYDVQVSLKRFSPEALGMIQAEVKAECLLSPEVPEVQDNFLEDSENSPEISEEMEEFEEELMPNLKSESRSGDNGCRTEDMEDYGNPAISDPEFEEAGISGEDCGEEEQRSSSSEAFRNKGLVRLDIGESLIRYKFCRGFFDQLEEGYRCCSCGFEGRTILGMKKHCRKVHPDFFEATFKMPGTLEEMEIAPDKYSIDGFDFEKLGEVFRCSSCPVPKSFTSWQGILVHMNLCHRRKRGDLEFQGLFYTKVDSDYRCDRCGTVLKEEEISLHKQKYHSDLLILDDLRITGNKFQYGEHVFQKVLRKGKEDKKHYKCFCAYVSSSSSGIVEHIRTAHAMDTSIKILCTPMLFRGSSLNKLLHHQVKPNMFEIYEQVFTKEKDGQEFLCGKSNCDYRSFDWKILVNHMRSSHEPPLDLSRNDSDNLLETESRSEATKESKPRKTRMRKKLRVQDSSSSSNDSDPVSEDEFQDEDDTAEASNSMIGALRGQGKMPSQKANIYRLDIGDNLIRYKYYSSFFDQVEGGYSCTACQHRATTFGAMKKHCRAAHAALRKPEQQAEHQGILYTELNPNEGSYRCDKCGLEVSQEDLKTHKTKYHTDLLTYQDLCIGKKQYSFQSHPFKKVTITLKSGRKGKRCKCLDCGDLFPTLPKILEHFSNSHGAEPPVRIVTTPIKYLDRGKDQESRLMDYQVEPNKYEALGTSFVKFGKSFKCMSCEAVRDSWKKMVNHMGRHKTSRNPSFEITGPDKFVLISTDDKTYGVSKIDCSNLVCDLCGVQRTKLNDFKKHFIETHGAQVPVNSVCETCGKGFPSEYLLHCHAKTHSEDSKKECKICGKQFSWKSSLKNHEKIHLGEASKVFQCEVCGKAFRAKGQLKNHMVLHNRDGHHLCPDCGKVFQYAGTLHIHRSVVHVKKRRKEHPCPECGVLFLYKTSIRRHILVTHRGVKSSEVYKRSEKRRGKNSPVNTSL